MADQQPSAPACPMPGIRHINRDHHRRYVKVGNHLAQHRELSLTAIGLAVHIQSLPSGARVTIKSLAGRFPEGEVRIAAAMRELEHHGYLRRHQQRAASGRVVTCTESYNNPPALWAEARAAREAAPLEPAAARPQEAAPGPDPAPTSDEEEPDPEPAPGNAEQKAPARPEAYDLLARLRLRDPRLVLSKRDVERLAPAVSEWLDQGLPVAAVSASLTNGLPLAPIHSPYGLLLHRIRELAPARLPAILPVGAARPDRVVHPLRTCPTCDKAHRSPTPGECPPCTRRRAAA
ncbi:MULTISPECIES: helix-turn-helix domain-containing protein [Streptomyces]|uniref:helix-turn-helix domain-containing protein n=1 Tax=Streptomyces TaxID=1883 RepID=UPI001CC2F137|nr:MULTISPECIES: helix-turn-helix domain-containing protein [Streptomyces]